MTQVRDVSPWPDELAERYRELGYWTGESLDAVLAHSARQFPDQVAVVDGSRKVTYDELDKQVTRCAAGLVRRGLTGGARILVQLPNCLEAIQVLLALFRAGAVPILCLAGHRQWELRAFARRSEAIAYITADEFDGVDGRELALDLTNEVTSLKQVIVVGENGPFESWQAVAEEREQAPYVADAYASDRMALLQLSGGSTGEPKLIPRTHNDYLYSIRRSTEICEWTAETVYLLALPWGHNFPMSSPGFLGCLLVGGRVVLAPDPSPDTCLRLMQEQKVTVTAAVPGLAEVWLESFRGQKLTLPSLQVIQVGGARLFPALARQLELHFRAQVQQVFGMAEGLVCYTRAGASQEQRLQTQGLPMSEADELRVVDEHDEPVAPGQVGRLLTRGPYTIRGYYRAEAANRAAFTADGFYRTGDLVRLRSDDSLVVEGRAKETINRGGEKVSPSELEGLLRGHAHLTDVAVVGSPDARLGERVVVCFCARVGIELTGQDLMRWLKEQQVASFKLPDRFVLLPQLPRTPVGKVDKQALLQTIEAVSQSSTCEDPGDGLVAWVAQLLELPAHELSPEANLLEQGLDSLRLMSLVEQFRVWGVEVGLIDLAEEPTIESFRRILGEHDIQVSPATT